MNRCHGKVDGGARMREGYGMEDCAGGSSHRRVFRTAIFAALFLMALSPAVRGEEPRPMTPGEIHSMPRDEAALARPVKVRGVVTYAYPEQIGDFVIEDESGGLYIQAAEPRGKSSRPVPGTLVEVTGMTGEGGYAPVVTAKAIKALGTAPLPVARPATVNQLLTGRFDSRRVEVRGVVQHAEARNQVEKFGLELDGEFGRVTVLALDPGAFTPADLIDAEVTVRAVCFPFFNERAQVAGVRLEMGSAEEIEINRPPFEKVFSTPLVALDRLQPFSPIGNNFHRKRIRGTVTLIKPGSYLYLQDGDHAVRVNLAGDSTVQVGDRIEAVGFPSVRTRFVEWHRSVIRKTGTAPVPPPVASTPERILRTGLSVAERAQNDWDGRLITLTGRLDRVEILKDGQCQLYIESGGQITQAILGWRDQTGFIASLRPGSSISATGICVVQYSDVWPATRYADPTGMSLLLRHSSDIRVLRAASWWTPTRLRLSLGVILAVLLASLAWARSLRREVVKRTAALVSETRARRDAEVEFNATSRERERMAVDLHDTVEQALTGVSYQLQVSEALHAGQPQRSLQHLDLAKQLLAQSREEVRRSVWNLRAQALNGRNLAEVLRDVAAGLSTRNPARTHVSVIGEERDLPDFIAGHLLLLAQESMTNAIKHAKPENIRITLEFGEGSVELRVHDDGIGFDPVNAPGLSEGHLGLQGMRERMKRLGGTVKVESAPGQGTTIRARVPLPA
ncbi:sensor histidine kinase [Akkermansiaceae bacterium]|nr:sensor histidine kinase [Akkermansiaceae bacterium]